MIEFISRSDDASTTPMRMIKASDGQLFELDAEEYPLAILIRNDGYLMHMQGLHVPDAQVAMILRELADELDKRVRAETT